MDLGTVVGMPILGVLIFGVGLWSRTHLDLLAGDQGSEDVVERRRVSVSRGATAMVVAGGFLFVGGLVIAFAR
jgi:hypothetical protein